MALATIGLDGKILTINAAAEEILGLDHAEVLENLSAKYFSSARRTIRSTRPS